MDVLGYSIKDPVKRKLLVFSICFIISLMFLLLATKSSPLYPFNDWVDANISFTMGKGMMNGKIPYRDLFDHKGPLFYLLFGLAYLVSNTTFLGVFFLEVISFSVFLFFSFKFLSQHIVDHYALMALPFLAAIVINLNSFVQGGSAEEFCLPFVVTSLYYLSRYFKNYYPQPMPNRWLLLNGLIAGCVLWIKFSLLGFWFGWMLSIFICLLIKKGFSLAIKASLVFLSGMLLATLPWLIYFGVNQSIIEWVDAYFVFNLTGYSQTSSFVSMISSTIFGLLYLIISNPIPFGLMYFGMVLFVGYDKFMENFYCKISLLSCLFFLAFSVFGGGRIYLYYPLIFSPFIIYSFLVLLCLLFEKIGQIKFVIICPFIVLISLIISISYTFLYNNNRPMIDINKNELVQYKYASIINQIDDPSLLNYGSLDLGFYTTTGIIPNIRFFHKPNIPYDKFPMIMDEQNRYIQEKIVDFVVIQLPTAFDYEALEIPFLDENYKLIEAEIQVNEDNEFYYLLYKKRFK